MKVCMVCGKELPDNYTKDKCKRCFKKGYASKIIIRLLESIDPEVPFKKEDLSSLGLMSIQISDYIWTLQEFDLINENKTNHTYSLKDENTLKKFIAKWGDPKKLEEQNQNHAKLSKTCPLCGKTLNISEFTETSKGIDEYCKNCKRLMRTAKGLNNILTHVDIGFPFKKEDLNDYFPEPLILTGTIWDLQDANLISYDDSTKKYTIKDESIIRPFLNKYLIEEDDEIKINIDKVEDVEEVKVDVEPTEIIESNIQYFISDKTLDSFEIIAKGSIKNSELFDTIAELKVIENSLKRIMSYKKDDMNTEIIIELQNNLINLDETEKQIKKLGWDKLG